MALRVPVENSLAGTIFAVGPSRWSSTMCGRIRATSTALIEQIAFESRSMLACRC